LKNGGDGESAAHAITTKNRLKAEKLTETSSRILTEDEGKQILSCYGIPVPKERLGRSLKETKGIASKIGYPVALKVVSPEITHKTEAGGLKLNIRNRMSW
jgi:acyl-CoA synthetase (NDP forming)